MHDHVTWPAQAPQPVPAPTGPRDPCAPVRFGLVLPAPRSKGGFNLGDILETLLGSPLFEVLGPFMQGPVSRMVDPSGRAMDVYPIALPPGNGISIQLLSVGELGFHHDGGLLKLVVPWHLVGWVQPGLTPFLLGGPAQQPSMDGKSVVAAFWLQLVPEYQVQVPLGPAGTVGLLWVG